MPAPFEKRRSPSHCVKLFPKKRGGGGGGFNGKGERAGGASENSLAGILNHKNKGGG